jgi:antitoxin component YwqK of YwqJK toxin-antitoxin module
MKRLILLLTVALAMGRTGALACVCTEYYTTIDGLAQLKDFAFIAHVKIGPMQPEQDSAYYKTVSWSFRIIELFKGSDTVRKVFDNYVTSSCDLGIREGEEWLFFAYLINGKMTVTPCSRNTQYRKIDGSRNLKYGRSEHFLQRLRELYRHPQAPVPDGKQVVYYANGKEEVEAFYLNGKLHGTKRIWYPDGKLYADENYVNGIIDGVSHWYYPSGQLSHEDFYVLGKHCNVSRIYYDNKDIAMPAKLWTETIYNYTGHAILHRSYTSEGRISHETITDATGQLNTSIHHHENGNLYYITQFTGEGHSYGHFQEYDKEGFPSRGGEHDEKGNVIWEKKQPE